MGLRDKLLGFLSEKNVEEPKNKREHDMMKREKMRNQKQG